MNPRLAKQQAQRDGRRTAQRRLEALGVSLTAPIDVFQIIQDEGIWLMFQPMRGVYGAYQRQDGSPGVLLNAKHPLPLQRFTAAHEYGHHVLGHERSFDSELEIEEANSEDLREVAAQAFAAEFLMPLGLVNRTLRELSIDIDRPQLGALDVYRLSLSMGASYTATVYHLVGLKKLTRERAQNLRRVAPKEIKEAEVGHPLEQTRADCWFLDRGQADARIRPRIGDEIHLRLPASPSTGHIWHLADTEGAGGNTVAQIDEGFTHVGRAGVGAPGTQRLAFRVQRRARQVLEVVNARPWDTANSTLDRFRVEIDPAAPLGERTQGLTDRQQVVLATI
jgi:Zn-dependent peptidase ImmA (M78 family)/predicted secreted protein